MESTIVNGREAVLSEDTPNKPYTIHGVALGENDVTRGKSGIVKKWTKEALKNAASTLAKKPLVKNHDNTVEGTIGKVKKSKYKPGVGVIFEAELSDSKISQKISDELLDVSARISHKDSDELDEGDDGVKIVNDIKEFLNLSVVPTGASKSNHVETGPSENLSAAELASAFDYEVEELASYHTPSYSDTSSSSSWSEPDMEDFPTDDLSEIDDAFIASSSGFPPTNFTDLGYPVVNGSGTLVLGGLDSAWKLKGNSDNFDEQSIGSVVKSLVFEEFPDSDLASRIEDDGDTEENGSNLSLSEMDVLSREDYNDVAEIRKYEKKINSL